MSNHDKHTPHEAERTPSTLEPLGRPVSAVIVEQQDAIVTSLALIRALHQERPRCDCESCRLDRANDVIAAGWLTVELMDATGLDQQAVLDRVQGESRRLTKGVPTP